MMSDLIGRKELCEALHVSRTHLTRIIKRHNIKPIDNGIYEQKLLYKVEDIEKAFGIRLSDKKLITDPEEQKKVEKKEEKSITQETLLDIEKIIDEE